MARGFSLYRTAQTDEQYVPSIVKMCIWMADVRVGEVPAGGDEPGGHPGKRRWWPARASRG